MNAAEQYRRVGLYIFASITICVLFSSPLLSQYTTASLAGTVLDQSGAVVPEATVTIQNVGIGMKRSVTTFDDGSYLFPVLMAGAYRLTVEKPGFSLYRQEGITLNVDQVATQSVTLQVGTVRDEVTVSANALMLPAQTATASQIVDRLRISELPLNGRLAPNLLFLTPGTINATLYYCGDQCQGGVYPGAQWGIVSGGGPGNVSYEMDGGDHNDHYINSNLPFPNPDAIQEFSVQSNNMSAEYGNSSGVVNVVTKSGSNQLHGDVFEFVRNRALNARNFFASTQDTLQRNQFGGTLGGPIRKDKQFFFGSYQGTRLRSAPAGVVDFVATALERGGDFSDFPVEIIDPFTNTPFPNNQIPADRLSAPAQYFLERIPLPNGPNGQLTFAGPEAASTDNQFMPKVDYVTGRNQLSIRYFFANYDRRPDMRTARNNALATDASGNRVRVETVAINDAFTATPTLLFNTWLSYNGSIGRTFSGALFGFPDAGIQITAPPGPKAFEGVNINGYMYAASGHPGSFDRSGWKIREILGWQKGRHEFHFGGELLSLKTPVANTNLQSGQFTFGSAESGSNLSDFILGMGANFSQNAGIYYDYGGVESNLFVQDNWRVSPKLTLNIGLRWDPFLPYTDARDRIPCYRPGLDSRRYPNAPSGLIFAGDAGCPAGGTDGMINNLAPRFGFAYRLSQHTVIRGGAGIYYTLPNTDQINGFASVAPFAPAFKLVDVSFRNPWASAGMANPFPGAYGNGTLPGPDARFVLPVGINGVFPETYHLPTLGTWNMMIQHQVGMNWLFSAGYFGNRGYHLSSNAIRRQELNPAIYIPGQSTHANTQARRVNPDFSSISLYSVDQASSYQALQLGVEKRFGRGFSLLANYTLSKTRDDMGPISNPFDLRFDWGTSNMNLPQVFHLSVVWDIPGFGWGRATKVLLNGWRLAGIQSWQSGFSFTVYSGSDNSFSGVGFDRADFTGSSYGQALLSSSRSHSQMAQRYFNTALFDPNAIGTFGNSPRNAWHNPGLFNADVAIIKKFKVSDRAELQFRTELFNAFNNVNFTVPGLGSANPNTSAVGNTVGTANFGKLTHAADPRILQFALKFSF